MKFDDSSHKGDSPSSVAPIRTSGEAKHSAENEIGDDETSQVDETRGGTLHGLCVCLELQQSRLGPNLGFFFRHLFEHNQFERRRNNKTKSASRSLIKNSCDAKSGSWLRSGEENFDGLPEREFGLAAFAFRSRNVKFEFDEKLISWKKVFLLCFPVKF